MEVLHWQDYLKQAYERKFNAKSLLYVDACSVTIQIQVAILCLLIEKYFLPGKVWIVLNLWKLSDHTSFFLNKTINLWNGCLTAAVFMAKQTSAVVCFSCSFSRVLVLVC